MRHVLILRGKQKKYHFLFSDSNNTHQTNYKKQRLPKYHRVKSYTRNTVPERLAEILNLNSGCLSITIDFEGDLMVGYYPTKVDQIVDINEMVDENACLDYQDRNDAKRKELCHEIGNMDKRRKSN